MFSPVASTIFTFRNIDKTENGEIGRAPVALGQAVGVLGEISKYDNALAVGAKNVLSVFGELAQENKVMNYASKFAKFASNNVNPLIAASGGVKVLMSDDKQSAAITEAAALSAMFGGEALVKKNYDKIAKSKGVQDLLKLVADKKYIKPLVEYFEKKKWGGATAAVVKGLLFLSASMTSYEVGHKVGDKAAKQVKNIQEEKALVSQNKTIEELTEDALATVNIPDNNAVKINHVA